MAQWRDYQLDAIYRRSGGRCIHCGRYFRRSEYGGRRYQWNVEHQVPRSMGGPDWVDNLAVSCVPCNQRKGNRFTPRDFAKLTRHIRRKRARPPREQRPLPGGVSSTRLAFLVGVAVFVPLYLALNAMGVQQDAGTWSLVAAFLVGTLVWIWRRQGQGS